MNRLTDPTGVSGTGEVLQGVVLASGKVVVEWRKPHQTMGIYGSFEEFKHIHVDAHPDCNEIIFLDISEGWHCFACGASGNDCNFCSMCGSPSTGYHPAFEGFKPSERHDLEKELDLLNVEVMRLQGVRRQQIVNRLRSGVI